MRSIASTIRGILNTFRYVINPYKFYAGIQGNKDPVNMDLIQGNYFITSSAIAAKEVFTAEPSIFDVGDNMLVLNPVLGSRSIILLAGDDHLAERKMVSPPFSNKSIGTYAERMRELAIQNTASWRSGDHIVIKDVAFQTSLDIIIDVVFGARESKEAEELGQALLASLELFVPSIVYFSFLRNRFFKPWVRFSQAKQTSDELVYQFAAKRQAAGNAQQEDNDLLSVLLSVKNGGMVPLTREGIRDHLVTMLTAGHETAAAAMSWAVYHLLKNPDCLKKVREELDTVPADAPAEAYSKLPYLNAVCYETLRIYPIILDVERKLRQDWTLLGTHIPKGSGVLVSISNIHRDTELFPEPECFRPERFIDRDYNPWEFLPFGGGIRRCIGASLALLEMKVVLGTLLREWDIELVDNKQVFPVRRHITMVPDGGVPIVVIGRRNQSV